MSITLYYTPMGSATRCHWALQELEVPFEKVRLQFDKGDHKRPEFLAINPNGKVPALVDGDVKLFESLAILFHLGDRYGVAKGLWPATGTDERSLAYVWSVWAMVEVQTAVFDYIRHAGSHPRLSFPKERQHKDAAERCLATWNTAVRMLDDRLSSHEHLLGKEFSLCDVAVASVVGLGPMMGQLSIDSKRASDWLARCQGRPALARALSEG
jgi:glutathione S-transferase